MSVKLSEFSAEETRKGFRHFDLGLTGEERDTLSKMHVGSTVSYDNFGDTVALETDAASFFEKLGNDPIEAKKQASILARLVNKTIGDFGSETAWVTIRASQPTHEFDTPRWHTDGYYYPPYEGDQHKAVIALKGTGTLLNDLPEEKREDFKALQRPGLDEAEARKQRASLIDPSQTETTPAGMGTVFVAGSDHAAVHSEPPIPSERIFVSVLPGTKQQIEALRQNWKRPTTREVRGEFTAAVETRAQNTRIHTP